jgi:hypothetical protein
LGVIETLTTILAKHEKQLVESPEEGLKNSNDRVTAYERITVLKEDVMNFTSDLKGVMSTNFSETIVLVTYKNVSEGKIGILNKKIEVQRHEAELLRKEIVLA